VRIGELARRSGVSVRALRYYEENGLLTSTRSSTGQREYEAAAADRVALIQQLFAAGTSSTGIRRLLPAVEAGEATAEVVAELHAQRRRIHERIAQLQATAVRLDAVIDVAEHPGHDCAPVEADERSSRHRSGAEPTALAGGRDHRRA
jgi:DNA-binding transcriptional MerR regulator